jgi:hypothetical protein
MTRTIPTTGNFLVANYETRQDPELAFDTTPYCWIVQTAYISATDTGCARMTADLAGFTGKPRYNEIYRDCWRNSVNHTEAALEFMRAHILPSGRDAHLLSLANTERGMLFVFI